MPNFDRVMILVTPQAVEFPFQVNGSSAGLSLNVFQSNAENNVLRVSVYKGSVRQTAVTGILKKGSIIAFGSQEFELLADFDGDGTPQILGGPGVISPYPALDAPVRIVSVEGAESGENIWCRIENEDIGQNVVTEEGGPIVQGVATASLVVDPMAIGADITIDSRLIDDDENVWQVQGISRTPDRKFSILACERVIA